MTTIFYLRRQFPEFQTFRKILLKNLFVLGRTKMRSGQGEKSWQQRGWLSLEHIYHDKDILLKRVVSFHHRISNDFLKILFPKTASSVTCFSKEQSGKLMHVGWQKKYQDEVSKTILCLLTQKLSIICHFIQLASIKRKCLSWQHNDNFHKSGSFVFLCITTSTFIS